jgi:hypothetical protein
MRRLLTRGAVSTLAYARDTCIDLRLDLRRLLTRRVWRQSALMFWVRAALELFEVGVAFVL